MKIHIVQREDTFQSIANKYGVSLQDLIGMNTHINHLSGLVPGLKVKVPQVPRKDEPTVDQHIQKYYPNLDVEPTVTHGSTTGAVIKPKPAVVPAPAPVPTQVVTKEEEEVIPIPLKPMPTDSQPYGQPNDVVVPKTLKETNKSMEEYLVYLNHEQYKMKNIYGLDVFPGNCGANSSYSGYYPPMPNPNPRDDARLVIGGFGGFGGYGGYGPFYGGYPFGGYYGGWGYGPYYGGWHRPPYGWYGGYGYGYPGYWR
ncbi:MAG TPA: LysM domain-containing protein [Firmicutes bacterium]|nr:LysM domain-containing protein [Bacillota bacterium]